MSLREHCIKILLKSDSVRFRAGVFVKDSHTEQTKMNLYQQQTLHNQFCSSIQMRKRLRFDLIKSWKFIPLVWLRACAFPTSTFLVSPVHSHPSLGHLTWQERMFLSVALSGNMSWMKTKHHPIEQTAFTKIGLIFYSFLSQDPYSLSWYRFIAILYHLN